MAWHGIIDKSFTPDSFERYVASLSFGAWRPRFVVVHNTSSPDRKTWDGWQKRNPPITDEQWGRNLEGYYKGQGWSGCPHLFVTPGGILVMNPLTMAGTHSPAWNSITWGVETVGEFDSDPFEGSIKDNLVAALAILHSAAGLQLLPYERGVRGLHFHKEDPKTTHKDCPGKHIVKADLIAAVQAEIERRHGGEHLPTKPEPAQEPDPKPEPQSPLSDLRLSMAKAIVDFEARRDKNGHLVVYLLPANDGGGRYEVAGINEKYDKPVADRLVKLVEAREFDNAELVAQEYIASNTDSAAKLTTIPSVEFYLRDCLFNRGAHGAVRILQRALHVKDDGAFGPNSKAAMERAERDPEALLALLRIAREEYERDVVGYRGNLWHGLENRWDKALVTARTFHDKETA